MTHQYPTLIREITTPTLPAFVTSCLNIISNSSNKTPDVPSSLVESVFRSFALLLPRHTAIYRPFASQIRVVTKPYVAPTGSYGAFVSSSLKESARHLAIALHQTVAKNAGGEEWSKAVRELVKDTHVTADNVFRAVIEDWESTAGYVGGPIDVNQALCGGGRSPDDLPQWSGIVAGVERLTGLLEMLAEYFRNETSTPVAIPLGSITDVVTRMLSIAMPASDSSSRQGSARLHPAIDRDEKDGLWCGMPQVYVAALQVVVAVAERLQVAFMPLAQGIFDQLVWVFPFGRSHPEFRLVTYVVVAKVLLHIGQSFDNAQVGKLGSIMRSCCKDLQPVDPDSHNGIIVEDAGKKSHGHNANQNADTFLQNKHIAVESGLDEADLTVAARSLLPLLLSHIPQQYVHVSLRSLIERTAILSHDKDAMLASILNPFVGKNGKEMASVLPHLTRDYGQDMAVEVLLRPRMPLVPSSGARVLTEDGIQEESEDEDMELDSYNEATQGLIQHNTSAHTQSVSEHPGLAPAAHSTLPESSNVHSGHLGLGLGKPATPHVAAFTPDIAEAPEISFGHSSHSALAPKESKTLVSAVPSRHNTTKEEDVKMDSEDESSDDESVHLTMELDTDSE
jgi:pre-rRNA-processing protein RIX1